MIAGVLAAGLFLFIRGIMPSPLKVILPMWARETAY